ncbi:MAG: hypothetical protein ACPG49_09890, partial [Chitinophagales bacterium]
RKKHIGYMLLDSFKYFLEACCSNSKFRFSLAGLLHNLRFHPLQNTYIKPQISPFYKPTNESKSLEVVLAYSI